MHPTLMYELTARYRQADMLREGERARLAHLASDAPRRRFRLRLRTRTSLRPALRS